jgi:hypothetical protein
LPLATLTPSAAAAAGIRSAPADVPRQRFLTENRFSRFGSLTENGGTGPPIAPVQKQASEAVFFTWQYCIPAIRSTSPGDNDESFDAALPKS